MNNPEEMTLEEKVDEILRYQRNAHRMAIIRGIISFLLFFILIVLPLFGFYYWVKDFQENSGINLSEIGNTLQNAKNNATDIDDSINSLKKLIQ